MDFALTDQQREHKDHVRKFAREVIREATEAAQRTAAIAIGKAARPELKIVGES